METYISLLRGINVSGSKMIKMDQLKRLYHDLQFTDSKTYIQSGNVIFKTGIKDSKSLENQISAAIQTQFGFNVPVLVLPKEKLLEILNNNPFLKKDPDLNISELYVTLLQDVAPVEATEKLMALDFSPEKIAIINQVIYLFLPKGYGNTKLNNNLLESRLKTPATTRNWKTIIALASIAE
jgi:uncharacterized protein (DUF1697 family)